MPEPLVVVVVAPGAATVTPALTVRVDPDGASPLSSSSCGPGAVVVGTVKEPEILPVASAVSVPSVMGSDRRTPVTVEAGFQPVEETVMAPPGATVGETVVPDGSVVLVDVVLPPDVVVLVELDVVLEARVVDVVDPDGAAVVEVVPVPSVVVVELPDPGAVVVVVALPKRRS